MKEKIMFLVILVIIVMVGYYTYLQFQDSIKECEEYCERNNCNCSVINTGLHNAIVREKYIDYQKKMVRRRSEATSELD